MDKENNEAWKSRWGINLIKTVPGDRLEQAFDSDKLPSKMELDELGDLMFVLANHHLALAAEMGRNYSRVQWNSDRLARARLNVIKPIHDSIELKITVLKKLFDRKVRQDMRRKND